jgi:hypothetical protein
MNDLRKYIDILNDQELLAEKKKKPFGPAANAPKIGAERVGTDGLVYQFQGKQWVQKAGQKGGKGRIATKNVAQQLTTQELKSRGNLISKIIKKNPRLSSALAAIVGIKLVGTQAKDDAAAQAQSQTAPPQQSGRPDVTPPQQSGQEVPGEDISAIKAEIDALIKELEQSTDPNIKKELDRIKGKLTAQPKPKRWTDNPSVLE